MSNLIWAAGLGVAGVGGAGLWWIRRRYVAVVLHGTSMEPTYRSGDQVVVRRTPVSRIRRGDVVVTRPPSPTRGGGPVDEFAPWLIKRVLAVPGDRVPRERVPALRDVPEPVVPEDRLVLLGDNADSSYDSRVCGYFEGSRLLGVVVRARSAGQPI